MAWTRTLTLGLLTGLVGCVVSVDDDGDDDAFGGSGGSFGVAGSGGRSGSDGGSAAGSSGSAGDGGSGGDDTFPAPTCEEEPNDENDECARCLKQNCCSEWLGCDDDDCTFELREVSECVQAIEFATTDDLGMCISMSSVADDGFVRENTQAVLDCAIASADDAGVETLCSSECFGSDIYPE